MITTVIGAYPKPNYLKITDWFNAKGGTDNPNPTKFYTKEIKKMGDKVEELFFKAANLLESTITACLGLNSKQSFAS